MPTAYQLGATLLRLDHISLAYGEKLILRDISASIRDIIVPGRITGQVVALLGPSGIGKTQLFRIVAGLNQASSGNVFLENGTPTSPGAVGVVAQNYPLFAHRSVWSNLYLAAKRREPNAGLAKEKTAALLNEFNLSECGRLYPAQLSGGQRQRCAILQQVLCSGHFLLLDEPFSGLDPVMQEKTVALLQQVADRDELNTLVVVTHDVTAACAVADHVWLLGRERDAAGQFVPGARIIRELDLIERDLCWHPGIQHRADFLALVSEIKQQFREL